LHEQEPPAVSEGSCNSPTHSDREDLQEPGDPHSFIMVRRLESVDAPVRSPEHAALYKGRDERRMGKLELEARQRHLRDLLAALDARE